MSEQGPCNPQPDFTTGKRIKSKQTNKQTSKQKHKPQWTSRVITVVGESETSHRQTGTVMPPDNLS